MKKCGLETCYQMGTEVWPCLNDILAWWDFFFFFSMHVRRLGLRIWLFRLGPIILTTDKILKTAIVAASIRFPSALFGMFYLFSILVILSFLFFENNSSYTWFHCPGWCNWFDGFLWNFSHFHSKVVVVVLYSFFGCTWLEPKLPVWFIFLFFYFFPGAGERRHSP